MITKLPSEFKTVIAQNNGLQQYLSNLQKGKQPTQRSWLYENENPKTILEEWKRTLSTLSDGNAFEKKVFQFDISSEAKWGSQGGVQPLKDLMKDIVLPSFELASSPLPAAFSTSEWKVAKQAAKRELISHVHNLRPASYAKVVDDMRARDTLESNSGWPDFTRRNKPSVTRAAIHAATDGECYGYPAIALFRNYRQKTRMVWMFPMSVNIVEGSYFQPLQSTIVKANMPYFSPWVGFEEVRKQISQVYSNPKLCIAASDFTSTDAHFQLPTSEQTFDVMRFCFQLNAVEGLHKSIDYMHSIPLVLSDNEMIVGYHGVSSGSNWTNLIESIFDLVFSKYVAILEHNSYRGLYAIGDDSAWVTDSYSDAFAERLEKYGKDVGQIIKAEKTTNEPNSVKSLQRLFQRGYNRPDGLCRGVYPTIRALNSLIYPERFHKAKSWNSDMFCARTYMILENCVDHPLFEEFVKFVVKGQKDLIPFAKKSSKELRQITRKSKLVPGLNPTYNTEKRDHSLETFDAIRVAKNL